MDTTEVTQEQYEMFRTAGVSIEDQPHVRCSPDVNPSFDTEVLALPDQLPVCLASYYDPAARPNHPVVCVHFCDAVAYCAWAGKRLCGVMGRAGETLGDARDESSDFQTLKNDPEYDQRYNACSGGGVRDYPYGEMLDPERCKYGPSEPVDAPTDCVVSGSNPPILRLLGGASEYQDFCEDGSVGSCWDVGDTCGDLATPSPIEAGRSFRCCYELDE